MRPFRSSIWWRVLPVVVIASAAVGCSPENSEESGTVAPPTVGSTLTNTSTMDPPSRPADELLALLASPGELEFPEGPSLHPPPEVAAEMASDWDGVPDTEKIALADAWCDSVGRYESVEEWAKARDSDDEGAFAWLEDAITSNKNSWRMITITRAIAQSEYCATSEGSQRVAAAQASIAAAGATVIETYAKSMASGTGIRPATWECVVRDTVLYDWVIEAKQGAFDDTDVVREVFDSLFGTCDATRDMEAYVSVWLINSAQMPEDVAACFTAELFAAPDLQHVAKRTTMSAYLGVSMAERVAGEVVLTDSERATYDRIQYLCDA